MIGYLPEGPEVTVGTLPNTQADGSIFLLSTKLPRKLEVEPLPYFDTLPAKAVDGATDSTLDWGRSERGIFFS